MLFSDKQHLSKYCWLFNNQLETQFVENNEQVESLRVNLLSLKKWKMKFDHLRRLNESEETKVVAEAEYKHIREVKIEKAKLEEENEKLSQNVHENESNV